jgi:hypothetical protein
MLELLALFDPHRAIAALAGGVCASIIDRKSGPGHIIASIIVGGLCGSCTYGGDPFITGVIAMPLCKGAITYVKRNTR